MLLYPSVVLGAAGCEEGCEELGWSELGETLPASRKGWWGVGFASRQKELHTMDGSEVALWSSSNIT